MLSGDGQRGMNGPEAADQRSRRAKHACNMGPGDVQLAGTLTTADRL